MSGPTPAADGRICVVGSLNADLVVRTRRHPRPGETLTGGPLETSPGGKSANQAAAAARLGAQVTMVGAVGDDAHGELLLDSLAAHGVDTAHVRRVTGTATGTAVITVSDDGENTIVISPGANGTLTPQDLPAEAFRDAAAVALTFEVPPETVLAAAQAGRRAGAAVVLNPSPFAQPSAELLAAVDVLVVNAHEMAQLLPGDVPDLAGLSPSGWEEQGGGLHRATGVPDVVVTLGADGAVLLRTRDGRTVAERIPGVAVRAVDTTGAGDAVTGTLTAALAAGTPLPEAVGLAMRVAALSTTERGAQPSYPDRDALDALA